jgi:hypothetical protein
VAKRAPRLVAPGPRVAAMQSQARRFAALLRRDALTGMDRRILAIWLDGLAGPGPLRLQRKQPGQTEPPHDARHDARRAAAAVDALNKLLVAIGGKSDGPRRKNASRRDAIGYDWYVARRLGRRRDEVARRWRVEPETVTHSLRTAYSRRRAELRLTLAIEEGQSRGLSEQQVLEDEERHARPRR